MRFVYSLFLLCVLALSASAQSGENSRVQGKVFGSDGVPVAGADVRLEVENPVGKIYGATTNESGNFAFKAPAGPAKISASFKVHGVRLDSQVREIRLRNGEATTTDLELGEIPRVRALVNIKIAANTSQPFFEVSKTVDVIEGEDIRNRNENSFADVLRTMPGFRIQQLGGFGRTTSIKTRGLRNQDTAILLDGQRLRDSASITGDASAFISDIETSNISSVEVLRGSGSSVYGTNAIGGVVDIRSESARKGLHGNFQSEYGGLGFSRLLGGAAYGTEDGRFGLTGGVTRTGFTRGIDGEDDANNTSLRGRIDTSPSGRLNIFANIISSDAFVRLNTNPDTFGILPASGIIDASRGVNFLTDGNDPDNFQRSNFVAGQVRASYIFDSKTVFSASYQGLKTTRENENGGLGPGFQPFGGTQFSFFDGRIHTLNAKIDWSPTRTGRLIAGYEYEFERYENLGVGPAASGGFLTGVNQSGNTFFVQYLQSFLQRKLQLAGGFRAQSFSLSSPEFSASNAPYAGVALGNPPAANTFDGAVSYYLESSQTKLRAHVGNGYRVPSLYERFGSFYSSFSQSFTALGDPDLEPERSIAFDVGVDQGLAGDRVRLSATYFYTQLTDTIGYGNTVRDIGTTMRPFGGYLNTKGGIARGAEFSATVKPLELTSLFTSYTYTNSDQREPQVTGSGVLRTLGVPDHRFTLNATQQVLKRLTLNFDFEASSDYLVPIFSSSSFSTYVYRFSGNRRGDLTVRYDLPVFNEKAKASFFASVENLFGYSYFENGFATAGRTARAGIAFRF